VEVIFVWLLFGLLVASSSDSNAGSVDGGGIPRFSLTSNRGYGKARRFLAAIVRPSVLLWSLAGPFVVVGKALLAAYASVQWWRTCRAKRSVFDPPIANELLRVFASYKNIADPARQYFALAISAFTAILSSPVLVAAGVCVLIAWALSNTAAPMPRPWIVSFSIATSGVLSSVAVLRCIMLTGGSDIARLRGLYFAVGIAQAIAATGLLAWSAARGGRASRSNGRHFAAKSVAPVVLGMFFCRFGAVLFASALVHPFATTCSFIEKSSIRVFGPAWRQCVQFVVPSTGKEENVSALRARWLCDEHLRHRRDIPGIFDAHLRRYDDVGAAQRELLSMRLSAGLTLPIEEAATLRLLMCYGSIMVAITDGLALIAVLLLAVPQSTTTDCAVCVVSIAATVVAGVTSCSWWLSDGAKAEYRASTLASVLFPSQPVLCDLAIKRYFTDLDPAFLFGPEAQRELARGSFCPGLPADVLQHAVAPFLGAPSPLSAGDADTIRRLMATAEFGG
jgi:hypothetical protein